MSRFDWFDDAGLGLFIHWGLYAIPAKGEWHLWKNRVPLDEYDALAERFAPPASFSPERWVLLAKRMGAKCAVLTTRHHDGFCLWDTKTTNFNSVKTAAKRDFVREFSEACRRHGIRVGFYFSIMNWQFQRRMDGTDDAELRSEQVENCHAALRELMTDYGKVDLLWYDGCTSPGADDAEVCDRVWRTRQLNAMVRSLQPEIIVNDRSTCNWLGGRHDVEIKAGSAPVLGDASDHYALPEGRTLQSLTPNPRLACSPGTTGSLSSFPSLPSVMPPSTVGDTSAA